MARSAAKQGIGSLSVLVPVYNSENTVGRLVDVLVETLSLHFQRIEIILVNDGSVDGSHRVALEARAKYPDTVRYVKLARNFGEHNAVMCGLRYVTCDAVAIIDDDFQNPPAEILKLAARLDEGFDVVYSHYAVKQHSVVRNLGSRFNDWMAVRLLKKPKGLYLSSFKVMNRFLVETVTQYEGPYPYLDGLILRSTNAIGTQLCQHRPREVGKSGYTLKKLVSLWLNMFTNFSLSPLRLSAILGLAMSAFGFGLTLFFVLCWFLEPHFMDQALPRGWASIICTITIFAGIQLCVLGMIGEYLGRLFLTHNRHPQYVVREEHVDSVAPDH